MMDTPEWVKPTACWLGLPGGVVTVLISVLSPQVVLPDLFSIYDYVAVQRPLGPSQETWMAPFLLSRV